MRTRRGAINNRQQSSPRTAARRGPYRIVTTSLPTASTPANPIHSLRARARVCFLPREGTLIRRYLPGPDRLGQTARRLLPATRPRVRILSGRIHVGSSSH